MKIIRTSPSEATIQAELYFELKKHFNNVHLEQNFFTENLTRRGKKEKVRADVMVCSDDDEVLFVIEVKNCGRGKSSADFAHTRQYKKYENIKIPFTYCTGLSEIKDVLNWCFTKVGRI